MGLIVQQFLPDLGYRSAISFHEFGTRRALAAAGIRGDIWAEEIHSEYGRRAAAFSAFEHSRAARRRDSLLLYSCSTGSRGMADALIARPERRTLYFHNITPGAFYEPYDAGAAVNANRGRDELRRFARHVRVATANSEFSAAELRDLGIPDVRVIYPYLQPGLDAEPSASHLDWLRRTKRGIDVLFVGRIAPNKGHMHLLRAFAALRSAVDDGARLFVVGPWGPEEYMRTLFRLRDRIGESGVVFTGSIDEPHLAAHYRAADAYLSMSLHEGFGVPLIEAMEQDLPVIAYAAGSVEEVLGGTGVLVRTTDAPFVSEVVARVAGDRALRAEIVGRQRARAAEVRDTSRDARIVDAVRAVMS